MILLLEFLQGGDAQRNFNCHYGQQSTRSPYRSHMAQLSKHEANKHRGNSRVARATAKHKSTSVVADAGRVPEIAGREIEKALRRFRELRRSILKLS